MNETFGRWKVTGNQIMQPCKGRNRPYIPCRCACGVEKLVRVQALRSGRSRSCGCLQREVASTLNVTHGGHQELLYGVWEAMRARCDRPNARGYSDYGGRGIRVCEGWQRYEPFRDWATANGYRAGLEIDRIDNDGNYCPENCRWTTRAVQLRNTRRTVNVAAFGETKCVADWSQDSRCRVSDETIRQRLKRGWAPEAAISCPRTDRAA